MDLSTRIRAGLAEGKDPDIIVSELVASGLSEPSARRLVDRAASQPLTAGTVTPAANDSIGGALDTGRAQMIAGVLFASLGLAITAYTYMRAQPGQRYTITYGLVVAGVVMFGKGVRDWLNTGAQRFPAGAIVLAAAVPFAIFFIPLGWTAWRESTRAEREFAAQEAAAAAEREEKERATQQRINDFQAMMSRAVQAQEMLIDGNPVTRCAGARIMAEQKLVEPFSELQRVASTDPEPSVRECATTAITAIKNANPNAFGRRD